MVIVRRVDARSRGNMLVELGRIFNLVPFVLNFVSKVCSFTPAVGPFFFAYLLCNMLFVLFRGKMPSPVRLLFSTGFVSSAEVHTEQRFKEIFRSKHV